MIATLNVDGLQSNLTYTSDVLSKCHILCIQEHWMLRYEVKLLTEFFPEHNFMAKCIDDNAPALPRYRTRGHAGTAIIWRQDIDHMVEPLQDGSDRLCAALVKTNPETILVNTYMPTEGAANADYSEVLDEVYEVANKYSMPTLLWTGDINADVHRDKPSRNDAAFKEFCKENYLQVSNSMPPTPTFHHFNGHSKSTIDLFIHRVTENPISAITIEERNPTNTGPHDPVKATLHSHVHAAASEVTASHPKPPNKIRWDKVDIPAYRELTDAKLKALLSQINNMPASLIAMRINSILSECAKAACPPPPNKRRNKYKWQASFKPIAKDVHTKYVNMQKVPPQQRQNSPQMIAYMAAKRTLRKAQRQAAAKRRKDIRTAIMDACLTKNKDGFYKLVKQQRRTHSSTSTINFGKFADDRSAPNSWANYFAHLATPQDDECFDRDYQRHLQTVHLLQALTASTLTLPPVTVEDIAKELNQLKNKKAADNFGIAGEHVKMASPIIVEVLCFMTNQALFTGKLPEAFKLGSITPVIKKNKPAKDPNNYRRITITSIIGKIVEMHMMRHARPLLDKLQSRLQFGFSKGVSPLYAALMVTEITAEAKDTKSQLNLTFMDTSKAFDVIDHKGMLNSLHQQGVSGTLWSLFHSMYDGIQSVVKWKGQVSKSFEEHQGFRQGGNSSADCYKAGRNNLLNQLEIEPTYRLGHLNAGAIMVADDLALASTSSHSMQTAINIAQADAARERYRFNQEKTKTVSVNVKPSQEEVLELYGKPLGKSKKEVHLGITRTSSTSNKVTADERVKSARRAGYSLLGAGMHGLNGTGPEIATMQFTTYVTPTLLYGLETLVLSKTDIGILADYHKKCLRHMQHLPQSSAESAIYLLIGTLPAEAQLDIKALTLLRSIISNEAGTRPGEYIKEVIIRQAAVKGYDSASWTTHMKKTLRKYDLPNIYKVIDMTPSKAGWKKMVQCAVNDSWTKQLCEDANGKSSMEYVNLQLCSTNHMHPVWQDVITPLDIMKATVHAKLLIKRYPLATSPTAGAKRVETCPLCGEEAEDTIHFVLTCPTLQATRLPYAKKILDTCRTYNISIDPQNLIHYILDANNIPEAGDNYRRLCRNFLYKMHDERCKRLGGDSGYSLTRNK